MKQSQHMLSVQCLPVEHEALIIIDVFDMLCSSGILV